MTVHQFNPLQDSRWKDFVSVHPHASVFHSQGWLEALYRSYGYEPVVLTTTGPDNPLQNGLVMCKVTSWLTGPRLVSLPFSDHCQPLVDEPADLAEILRLLEGDVRAGNWKYLELRPLLSLEPSALSQTNIGSGDGYCFHTLDLRPSLDLVYAKFHRSCVQRKLHRAEREHLTIEEGRSERLLKQFFQLLITTRRRHGVPPQPLSWFRNLAACFGDDAVIRVASKDGMPIASIFLLTHGKTVVYKYGCSDGRYHNLGGMLFLFWRTIQLAKERGFDSLDLGRSDLDNFGLIDFKDHWGSTRTSLAYYRYPWGRLAKNGTTDWRLELAQKAFAHLPDFCLTAVGRLLYRHIG